MITCLTAFFPHQGVPHLHNPCSAIDPLAFKLEVRNHPLGGEGALLWLAQPEHQCPWRWLPEVRGWHWEGPEAQGRELGGGSPSSKPPGTQPGAHRHLPAGFHPESHQTTPGRKRKGECSISVTQRLPWKSKSGHRSGAPATYGWALNQLIICHHLYSQVLHLRLPSGADETLENLRGKGRAGPRKHRACP